MLKRKWLGDKTKGGFYKKQKGPDGEQRFALDWKTLEYRPQQTAEVRRRSKWRRPSRDLPERLHMLLAPSKDKASHLPLERALRPVDLRRQPHSPRSPTPSSKSIAP